MGDLSIYRGGPGTSITVKIGEDTRHHKALMGEDYIELTEEYNEVKDIAVGDYIIHDSKYFYVNASPEINKLSSRHFEHKVQFESIIYDMAKVIFKGVGDEIDFYLNEDLEGFVDRVVANMNRIFSGWSTGTIDASYKDEYRNLHFQGETCLEVLHILAEEFDAEFKLDGKAIDFSDEITNVTGYTFEYGSEKQFRSIQRQNDTNENVITRLYALGSKKNLPTSYRDGATRLEFAIGTKNYLEKNVATYGLIEKLKIFDEIFPTRTGSVSTITTSPYLFVDSGMDFNLNNYLLPGVKPKIHFQTGDLAGYEFEIESYQSTGKTFTIIPFTEENLREMPNNTLQIQVGDKYKIIDISLPTSYVDSAESLLQAKAQAYLDNNAAPKVTYQSELDERYLNDNSIDLDVGDQITISDSDLETSANVRVMRFIKGLAYPYRVSEIDFSNAVNKSMIERMYGDSENIKRKATVDELGDIPKERWGWWVTRGPNTGRTWATDSGMPGHYKRIVIDGRENKLSLFDSSNVEKVIIDDSIYGTKPGVKIIDGSFYNYKDGDNYISMQSEYMMLRSDYTGADNRIVFDLHYWLTGSTGNKSRTGIQSKITLDGMNKNDDLSAVIGGINIIGSGYSGNAFSGYFYGAHFYIDLGDDDGSYRFCVRNESLDKLMSVNSLGTVASKTTCERWLQDDRFPVKMHMIRNEQMNNLLDLLDSASEELNETDFATHAKWDTTGVGDDTGGDCDFTFAGGTLNGTCYQTSGNRVTDGTPSVGYEFTYTVVVTVAPDGDFVLTLENFPESAVTLPHTAGTHTVRFMSAANANGQNFTIKATETTSTQGSIQIDNVSLKRCKDIFVVDIDTGANTIEVSWLPYIENIWSPTSGEEWALLNRENTDGGADPIRTGNYQEILQITGGTYSTRILNYDATDMKGAEGNWSVGDLCMFYNPYDSNWEWPSANPIIEEAGAGWRSTYVAPGGHFFHSGGYLVLLVNGYSAAYEVGAFKSDDKDWETWSVLNSDNAIFTKSSAGDWRDDAIFSSSVLKLPNEDRFIAYCSGLNGSKWKIGYVKFDEDFSAGSIEYSDDEIVDSSGSGTSGYCAPSVIYYAGKYRMVYCDRKDGDPDNDDWCVKEAFADTPEGPFENPVTIFEASSTNEGIWRSSHSDNFCYFLWKGRLYLLLAGTSRYLASGTRGNRVLGLCSWDEKLATPAWVEDPRGPIFLSFYNDDIWPGIDDWAQDHTGGYPSMAIHPVDGKIYLFLSANASGDAYKIGVWKLDIQNLISETFN